MFHERPKGFPTYHIEALALEKMADDKWKRFEIKGFVTEPIQKTVEVFPSQK